MLVQHDVELDISVGGEAIRDESDLMSLLAADHEHGIDLSRAPTMRVTLVPSDAENRWWLACTTSHIMLDGWSLAVVLDEVLHSYEGDILSLPPPGDFRAYVEWIYRQDPQAMVASFVAAIPSEFRRGLCEPLASRRRLDTIATSVVSRSSIDGVKLLAIRELAKELGVTLATVVHLAYALAIASVSKDPRVTFFTTVAGRPVSLPAIDRTVGMFINAVPIFISVQEWESLRDFAERVSKAVRTAVYAQHVPYGELLAALSLPRETVLSDFYLTFENYPGAEAIRRMKAASMQWSIVKDVEIASEPYSLIVDVDSALDLTLRAASAHLGPRPETLLGRVVQVLEELAYLGADGGSIGNFL
jgi:hypothetical protein